MYCFFIYHSLATLILKFCTSTTCSWISRPLWLCALDLNSEHTYCLVPLQLYLSVHCAFTGDLVAKGKQNLSTRGSREKEGKCSVCRRQFWWFSERNVTVQLWSWCLKGDLAAGTFPGSLKTKPSQPSSSLLLKWCRGLLPFPWLLVTYLVS